MEASTYSAGERSTRPSTAPEPDPPQQHRNPSGTGASGRVPTEADSSPKTVAEDLDTTFLRRSGSAVVLNSLVAEMLRQRPNDPATWLNEQLAKRRFYLTMDSLRLILDNAATMESELLFQCIQDANPSKKFTIDDATDVQLDLLQRAADALFHHAQERGLVLGELKFDEKSAWTASAVRMADAKCRVAHLAESFRLGVVVLCTDHHDVGLVAPLYRQLQWTVAHCGGRVDDVTQCTLKLFVACTTPQASREAERRVADAGLRSFVTVVPTAQADGFGGCVQAGAAAAKKWTDDVPCELNCIGILPGFPRSVHAAELLHAVYEVVKPPPMEKLSSSTNLDVSQRAASGKNLGASLGGSGGLSPRSPRGGGGAAELLLPCNACIMPRSNTRTQPSEDLLAISLLRKIGVSSPLYDCFAPAFTAIKANTLEATTNMPDFGTGSVLALCLCTTKRYSIAVQTTQLGLWGNKSTAPTKNTVESHLPCLQYTAAELAKTTAKKDLDAFDEVFKFIAGCTQKQWVSTAAGSATRLTSSKPEDLGKVSVHFATA